MFDGLYSLWIYGILCSEYYEILFVVLLIIMASSALIFFLCKDEKENFLNFFKYEKHNKNNYLYLLLLILWLSLIILNSNFFSEIKVILIFFLLLLNLFIIDFFTKTIRIITWLIFIVYVSFIYLIIISESNFSSFQIWSLKVESCSTYVKTFDLSIKDLSKIKKGDYCIFANYVDVGHKFVWTISKKEADFILNDMNRIKQGEINDKQQEKQKEIQEQKQKDDLIKQITNN